MRDATLLQNQNNLIRVLAVAMGNPTANIVYSQVMREGVSSDRLFNVTSMGVVNVIGNLDREAASSYDVQIEASATDKCFTVLILTCVYRHI